MTTFLLLRHGAHLLGGDLIAGRTPGVHLSPLGHEQAERMAARVARLPVAAIYCSPAERTRETAEHLGRRLNLPVQIREALNELDFGEWTGRSVAELRSEERFGRWNTFRSGTRMPGGETMLEIQTRVVAELLSLRERHGDGCVALVSHGDVIKAALAWALGVPLDLFMRIEIGLASVSMVAVADYGPWVLCVNHGGEELPRP
jgi:probable phosphomutase (TIGR03848 family)